MDANGKVGCNLLKWAAVIYEQLVNQATIATSPGTPWVPHSQRKCWLSSPWYVFKEPKRGCAKGTANDKQNKCSIGFVRKDCSNKWLHLHCKETSLAVYVCQCITCCPTLVFQHFLNTNIYLLFPAPAQLLLFASAPPKKNAESSCSPQVATHHLFHEEWKHNALELGHVDDLSSPNLRRLRLTKTAEGTPPKPTTLGFFAK